jgi:cytochrome P450
MREEAPVHRIGDSDFYGVCGWDAVIDAIARVEDFSSNLTATMVYHPDGSVTPFPMGQLGDPSHALATADDPVHAAHRKILLPHLSAKRVQVIEQYTTEIADRLWHEHVTDGHIEWMSAIANRLPMMVVAELLGIPDADVDDLIRLGFATTTLLDGLVTPQRLEGAGAAAFELAAYVMARFENPDARSGIGLISDMATRYAAGELDQAAALSIMLTLFSAAGESTASLLGSAAWILATQPEIQRQLRDEPKLLTSFVEETLRYEPPFRGHYRHVVKDSTLGGVDVPGGSRLLLLWGAANRDPAQFEDPDTFRLDRSAAKGHVTFGRGAHFCIGAALARLEARIMIGTLLERTEWIEAASVGEWLPSILVRRLKTLELAVR